MHYPASELVIDPVLVRKYHASGPRYTSYPTADRFVEAFGETELRQWLAKRNIGALSQPLSLCVHLPFRENIRDHARSAQYIKYLERELALLGPLLEGERALGRMHWGRGASAFLARDEMSALASAVERTFERKRHLEYSIEIDPRSAEPGRMAFLASLGFNRACLGVQSEEPLARVVAEARAAGFRSVNCDLIYGLPRQTLDSFNCTLDKVLALDPDRIALYDHAHQPKACRPQRRSIAAELPAPELRLQLMTLAIGRLTRAGYLYIGPDHFARPHDELAAAQTLGQLQRGFQGYSTHCGDLVGIGVSALGQIGPTYYQNAKSLDDYYAALDAGRLPVARGIELTQDDLVRRAVIQALTCHFRVSIESIELAHLIEFKQHFAQELKDLRRLAADGLVELEPEWIVVTPKGRLLVRTLCMVFDRYLRQREARASYSKVI